MLITPQLKDTVLRAIVEGHEPGSIAEIGRDESVCGIGGPTLSELINHFEREGLLRFEIDRSGRKHSGTRDSIFFYVNIEAHDFLQTGGFFGRYELFQKNVEKLLWEVEKLERIDGPQQQNVVDIGKKIAEYVSLIANLTTIGGATSG